MKKLLLSLAIILGIAFTTKAQKEGAVNKISIGGDFLYPTTGLLKDSYNLGYGGTLQGEYNVYKKLNLTLSAGYLAMVYKQEVKDIYALTFPDSTKNDISYPKSSIDVGVRYEGWSSYVESNTKTKISTFVGLRAAYSFGF